MSEVKNIPSIDEVQQSTDRKIHHFVSWVYILHKINDDFNSMQESGIDLFPALRRTRFHQDLIK